MSYCDSVDGKAVGEGCRANRINAGWICARALPRCRVYHVGHDKSRVPLAKFQSPKINNCFFVRIIIGQPIHQSPNLVLSICSSDKCLQKQPKQSSGSSDESVDLGI